MMGWESRGLACGIVLFTAVARVAAAEDGDRTIDSVLGLDALQLMPKTDSGVGVFAIGLPESLSLSAPLSTALATSLDSSGTDGDAVHLVASWDGREDYTADRARTLLDAGNGGPFTRVAVSEHTVANGFTSNVYYVGDALGNFSILIDNGANGVDTVANVDLHGLIGNGSNGGFTLQNPTSSDFTSNQLVVTGIAVNPVADLGDFGLCDQVGEVIYVSTLDALGGASDASGRPIRTRIFAFNVSDEGGPISINGTVFQIQRSVLWGTGGIAVDDDGSLYVHFADLTQLDPETGLGGTGAAIVKVQELPRSICAANGRVNRVIVGMPTISSIPNPGQTTSTNSARVTNFSGRSATWGNVVALATGEGNAVHAALAPSFVATDAPDVRATQGLFTNPVALGATPSMIVTLTDVAGGISPTGLTTGDGFADAASANLTLDAGINNFRAFVLGNGPDRRGANDPVFGSAETTLKLDLAIDATLYAGLAVDEEGTVSVISGGTPAGAGTNPSPERGEILQLPDERPRDRRADRIDVRADALPNPPASGGNVGDGDSDRFDHVFLVAPRDPMTLRPSGILGLSRGFLRYTNRLAPVALGAGIPLGVSATTLSDDQQVGPINFETLDPSHQVAGGDDQTTPFRGDDDDGAGSPAPIAGALNGGFELVLDGQSCPGVAYNGFTWNANGLIQFGAGALAATPTVAAFLGGSPKVAGAWTDLLPDQRSFDLGSFPVQALGFAGVNDFKIRWINVPPFAGVLSLETTTFSISLFDDGTGADENATQPLNPANPIGNNVVPFDKLEGPTDLRFAQAPGEALLAAPPRPQGSGVVSTTFGEMGVVGSGSSPVLVGLSTGGLAANAVAESDLTDVARGVVAGTGADLAFYELFNSNDLDLRFEGNDPDLGAAPGQPDPNLERVDLAGSSCALLIFRDGFETGNTGAWSDTVP